MKINYPVKTKDAKEYDADKLYDRLQSEQSGHYLLGNHNRWHGGIHFIQKGKKEEPVYAIADGEIVAYRLNEKYEDSILELDDQAKLEAIYQSHGLEKEYDNKYRYSTSFVLIKHQLKVKRKEEDEGEEVELLTFYSLYMHLLPYAEYKIKDMKKITMTSSGVNIRAKESRVITGKANKNDRFKVTELIIEKEITYAVINEGKAIVAIQNGESSYATIEEIRGSTIDIDIPDYWSANNQVEELKIPYQRKRTEEELKQVQFDQVYPCHPP